MSSIRLLMQSYSAKRTSRSRSFELSPTIPASLALAVGLLLFAVAEALTDVVIDKPTRL